MPVRNSEAAERCLSRSLYRWPPRPSLPPARPPAHHLPFLAASPAATAIPPSGVHRARDTARAARAANVSSHLAAFPTPPARTSRRQPVAPDLHVTTSPTPAASHPVPTRSASQPPLIRIPVISYRVGAGLAPALVSLLAPVLTCPRPAPTRPSSLRAVQARFFPFHASPPSPSRAAYPVRPAPVPLACRAPASPACSKPPPASDDGSAGAYRSLHHRLPSFPERGCAG